MFVLYIASLGLLAFVIGAGVLGLWLRRHPSKANAEKSSKIMHFLYFAGLVTLPLIAFFYPGLTHFDELVGLDPLPIRPVFLTAGIILAIPGLYLLGISNRLLRVSGNGANAFRLTKQVVENDIYRYTRNPMSLGYYLGSLSIGLISGSTLATLCAVLAYIPAHIFFLKFFEEFELELRFGESYKWYKQKVPFLIPRQAAD